MASAACIAAADGVVAAAAFTGGWLLRGLRDWYRAGAERDREWDEANL